MAGQQKPCKGDKVRVTFDAVYAVEEAYFHVLDETDGRGSVVRVPTFATVEVLERADDPKVGQLRREDHDGGHSIWQVQENYDGDERFWCCIYSTAQGNRDVHYQLDRMLDLPVIGTVPGTPAWDAEQAEIEHADCFEPEPGPRKPVPLSEIFPPRLFKACSKTGAVEEPPESVKAVVDNQGDRLRREGDGWIGYGSEGSSGDFGYPAFVKPWGDHVAAMYAPYTEVV